MSGRRSEKTHDQQRKVLYLKNTSPLSYSHCGENFRFHSTVYIYITLSLVTIIKCNLCTCPMSWIGTCTRFRRELMFGYTELSRHIFSPSFKNLHRQVATLIFALFALTLLQLVIQRSIFHMVWHWDQVWEFALDHRYEEE